VTANARPKKRFAAPVVTSTHSLPPIGLSTLMGQNRQRFAEDARAIYRAARNEDCRSRTISAVAVRIDINPKAHASQP
jgi:hypothetical protein